MDSSESSSGTSGGGGADDQFVPREDLITQLTQLGFTRQLAIKSLFYTGNYNADLAAAWIFENGDEAVEEENSDSDDMEFLPGQGLVKMVCVVNTGLDMGVGKIAAQVAHGAVGLCRKMMENQVKYGQMLLRWEQFGETKIVLKSEGTLQFEELEAKAEALEIPNFTVQDAGKTQIASGSKTVLALMGTPDQFIKPKSPAFI